MARFKPLMNFCLNSMKVATVTFITLNYVGGFVVCYGPSMEPTLKSRDVLLTDHISPRLKKIDIGDVVVAKSPDDYRYVCKRVVAGPGDIVLFKNKTLTIPEESFWLEGDNKDNSNDSRYYGPVPFSSIRRRCFCRIWPQIDLNLKAFPSYYLQSAPTMQQKIVHQENEKQRQLLLLQQQSTSLGNGGEAKISNNNNGILSGRDGTFPMITANTAQRVDQGEPSDNFIERTTQNSHQESLS